MYYYYLYSVNPYSRESLHASLWLAYAQLDFRLAYFRLGWLAAFSLSVHRVVWTLGLHMSAHTVMNTPVTTCHSP